MRAIPISRPSRAAPLAADAFKQRLGWSFEWVSCGTEGAFNRDFGIYFSAEAQAASGPNYNYGSSRFPMADAPGISVFAKDADRRRSIIPIRPIRAASTC